MINNSLLSTKSTFTFNFYSCPCNFAVTFDLRTTPVTIYIKCGGSVMADGGHIIFCLSSPDCVSIRRDYKADEDPAVNHTPTDLTQPNPALKCHREIAMCRYWTIISPGSVSNKNISLKIGRWNGGSWVSYSSFVSNQLNARLRCTYGIVKWRYWAVTRQIAVTKFLIKL